MNGDDDADDDDGISDNGDDNLFQLRIFPIEKE